MVPYTPGGNDNPPPSHPYSPFTSHQSLSDSLSIGPQELLRTLAVASPRPNSNPHSATPSTYLPSGSAGMNGYSTSKGKTRLESLAYGNGNGGSSMSPGPSSFTPQFLPPTHGHSNDESGRYEDETRTSIENESDNDPREEIVDRFRLWRHDAMTQHLYETAIFWGDKVFTWTSDPNDAFWLAQAHFLAHHYLRAETILTKEYTYQVPRATSTKGKERDDMLRGNMPLMGGVNIVPSTAGTLSRLTDINVACRYLAAQCSVRLGKWAEALEMIGEVNPFRGDADEPPPFIIPDTHGGTKVESTMCYLRGVIMLRMGRSQDATESLMEALAIDYKNFDAFDLLISGEMLKVDEEWEFIQGLHWHQDDAFAAEFVRSMYTIRLRKAKHQSEMAIARHRLTSEYGMADNADLLFGFADSLFAQYRYADCFAITERILQKTRIHRNTLSLHIACMQHLPNLRSRLFLLAHELMQKEPQDAMSAYAVAVWYIFTKKYALARRWIAKTTNLDPRNGPAWIAFGHTFAFEREHEQAVTAYSTCARLFRGSHLPFLYIGMEHLNMHNFPLADDYLRAAFEMCDSDALLLNELGVLAYQNGKYQDAVDFFRKALDAAKASQTSEATWKGTYLNMGQAHRKLEQYDLALEAYEKVVTIDPRNADGLVCLGMIHHVNGQLDDAITRYHQALSIKPLAGNVIDLLNAALATQSALLAPTSIGLPRSTRGLIVPAPSPSQSSSSTIPPTTALPATAASPSSRQPRTALRKAIALAVNQPPSSSPAGRQTWDVNMQRRLRAIGGRGEYQPNEVEGGGYRHLEIMVHPGIPSGRGGLPVNGMEGIGLPGMSGMDGSVSIMLDEDPSTLEDVSMDVAD